MEKKTENLFEEPILLSAEDLEDVAGGCLFSCSDGSCRKPPKEVAN